MSPLQSQSPSIRAAKYYCAFRADKPRGSIIAGILLPPSHHPRNNAISLYHVASVGTRSLRVACGRPMRCEITGASGWKLCGCEGDEIPTFLRWQRYAAYKRQLARSGKTCSTTCHQPLTIFLFILALRRLDTSMLLQSLFILIACMRGAVNQIR